MQCNIIVFLVFIMGLLAPWSKVHGLFPSLDAIWEEEQPAKCKLRPRYGKCHSVYRNFYFDTVSGRCKTFSYSGCGGNANNFLHLLDCEAECIRFGKPDGWSAHTTHSKGLPLKCEQPKETGPCKAMFPRYYYDVWDKKCTHFIYGGCGGNENNFKFYLECYVVCENPGHKFNPALTQETLLETCKQPKNPGPCKAAYPHFYYDSQSKTCKPFIYGGCQGNQNNFETEEECMQECM
ncbi:actinia tenebrosa protease inhibitors-like [Podarcis lilfordi]|uniref:Actinia tenebrosa protease inhibitors-like n=1 Tax=Podarcis lilfordi TaxID=74358 RepID=A0AA35PST4_9SAUR|nr:actinia tenebrosa protease inhibitors-like [Podarcis lilfordi]